MPTHLYALWSGALTVPSMFASLLVDPDLIWLATFALGDDDHEFGLVFELSTRVGIVDLSHCSDWVYCSSGSAYEHL